jgi:hypothetical protein
MIGTTIGHYTVLSKLGEGGMGDVYRARDTSLHRDVAIKVLPDSVAWDDDRLARFTREAQALAALNHTNIAHVYGLERPERNEASKAFIVMELVEGEDLAQRLARGPIPLDEALPIARQIAEGLEAAHEHGIVHRDLKPANIKVRPDGAVKVLDFGLAKELAPAHRGTNSPTFTSPAMTSAGMILGTAAYMSPEQAKGKAVDKRADIWAFGVVVYEMLTGRSPFAGDSVAESIGLVVTRDADWTALPADTPSAIRRLLARCLVKDPRHRLRDIGDALIELNTPSDPTQTTASGEPSRGIASWLVALLLVAAVAAAIAGTIWATREPAVSPRVVRFDIHAPGVRIDTYQHPVISPDGHRVAWTADGSLWVRDLERGEARKLVADLDPGHLAWSPDSQELMFFAKNRLWRTRVTGGDASEIADLGTTRRGASTPGAAWLEDGRIIFAPSATSSGLLVVDSRGGALQSFLPQQPGISDFHSPSPLPGNRGLLLVEDREKKGVDTISVLADGKLKILLQVDGEFFESPYYSTDGYIVFERLTVVKGIWAMPFSLETLSVTGSPFPVLPNRSWPSVSQDGTLLHTRSDARTAGHLVIVGRDGRVIRTIGERLTALSSPRLSPDERRAALLYIPDGATTTDLGVIDIATGALTRVTFSVGVVRRPQWVGNDKLIFETGIQGSANTGFIGLVAAEGGAVVKQLVTGAMDARVSPDRRWLLYYRNTGPGGNDILRQPLDPGTLTPVGPEQPFIVTPVNEMTPMFHPSGRFLLYRSFESNQPEFFLTRFPDAQGKWQVAKGPANFDPQWSRKGDSIVYAQVDHLAEVPITLEPTVSVGAPRVVLDANAVRTLNLFFDVLPDGNFLMVQRAQAPEQPTGMVSVVMNWAQEFKK